MKGQTWRREFKKGRVLEAVKENEPKKILPCGIFLEIFADRYTKMYIFIAALFVIAKD